MSFSHERTWGTWSPCADTIACPCPNHLADTPCLLEIFSDIIRENSPLHPILLSNDHLSPAEEDLLASSIANLHSKFVAADKLSQNLRKLWHSLSFDLQRIDRDIQRVELHLAALASAFERRRKVARCFIRRLPSEVLAHILSLTIDIPPHDGTLPLVWRRDPLGHELMKFERVSKSWRECILSHPSLWSRILIIANWDYTYWMIPESVYAARLARQIERTKEARLDVCISTMCSAQKKVQQLSNMVGHLLAPVFHRIESLHLLLPPPLIRGLHPLRMSFHALKKLYIRIDDTIRPDSSDELSNLFAAAPHLTIYETCGVPDPSLFGMPWHQIVHYESSSADCGFSLESQNVLKVLSLAGSLQEAAFRDIIFGSRPPPEIISTSIVCARLVSLELTLADFTGPIPIRQVFELCSFPVLARLHVTMASPRQYFASKCDWSTPFPALLRCIQRSRSPLCTLKYDHARVASADVTELLGSVPTLEEVQLTNIDGGIDNDVIQSLCVQDNGVIPLPRLRLLHLDGNLAFNLGAFVQMVKGRWDAAPLISIALRWCGSMPAQTKLNRHQRRALHWMRRQRESEIAVLIAELKVYESQGMALQTGLYGWKY